MGNEFGRERLYCDSCVSLHDHTPVLIYRLIDEEMHKLWKPLADEIMKAHGQSLKWVGDYLPLLIYLENIADDHSIKLKRNFGYMHRRIEELKQIAEFEQSNKEDAMLTYFLSFDVLKILEKRSLRQ